MVLMDIMMPELDGLSAMRAIRARGGRFSKLPIIAITAKAMPDDQVRCLQAGANDYIPKPLDVEMLLSLIRVWMPK
jgi:CheY-like chemotaxis protein